MREFKGSSEFREHQNVKAVLLREKRRTDDGQSAIFAQN